MTDKNNTINTDDITTIKATRRAIEWKDLRTLTRGQVVFNILLPYPFLVIALASAWHGYILFALFGWFLFFASSFRQAHDGFHGTLGINKKATDVLLSWSSALIMTSNHAVRQTHMEHHRNPLSESDFEASFHQLTWWQAIVYGAPFWLALQKHGLELAKKGDIKNPTVNNTTKVWTDFTLITISVMLAMIVQLVFDNSIFLYHIAMMCAANFLVGFFAGWLVHHDCHGEDHEEGDELYSHEIIARTERHTLLNILSFNLLFHMEHHLFPSVPANNLPEIAKRLDAAAPKMVSLKVVPEFSLTADKVKYITHTSVTKVETMLNKIDNSRECPIRK